MVQTPRRRQIRSGRFASPARCAAVAYLATCALLAQSAESDSWRIGDRNQPWMLFPVSFLLDSGEVFKPDYLWGGSHGVEIVVDDDGDGLVDEDPVDLFDDDGDGLFNEDLEDGIDNDRDGLIDEDGADLQFDNDGDGLINEDGLRTGGVIYSPGLRAELRQLPFSRYSTPEEAAEDPDGTGTGYGWGDDDRDGRFNEDDLNGVDDDGDGLIDEDPPGPPAILPSSWRLPTFSYDAEGLTVEERQSLAFTWDSLQNAYVAEALDGSVVLATSSQQRTRPRDWLRPIKLEPDRNMTYLTEDRFLSGMFSVADPMDSQAWGASLTGTAHGGPSGHGQVVDANIFSARSVSQASSSRGFRVHFRALFFLDLIRLRPRPDFQDRTPTSFQIWFAGDRPSQFTQRLVLDELFTRMTVRDFVIPAQLDQLSPAIKEYRFFEGSEFGDSPKVRILNFWSSMPEGQTWELAEFEAYGHGHVLDGFYTTEIIDVGSRRPRFRRYFDPEDPLRPVPFESIRTKDLNLDRTISTEELSSTLLADQFDHELEGSPVTWGRVRWHGKIDGTNGNIEVRVRSGTSLDTRVYQRKVGRGVFSQFTDLPITADWPASGSRVDAFTYVVLPGLERPRVVDLPPNRLSDQDGIRGGWTAWSSPFDFSSGLVQPDGSGGVRLPLPPLHRYIQFRIDFASTETSGISLDYLEFDFAEPLVTRGVLAEIFPDTTARLGLASAFEYVLKPLIDADDLGFNRIDIAVPSLDARLDSLLVDDLAWTPIDPVFPAGLSEAAGARLLEELRHSTTWLDTLSITESGRFASVTFLDSISGLTKMGIKTRVLLAADFPRGSGKDIQLALTTPVFRLLTDFESWIWNDAAELAKQATQPGNAADRLPSDQVEVTVLGTERGVELRTVAPNPFTPNGDGINEEARFEFDLFLVAQETRASLDIFSLNGEQVRELQAAIVVGTHSLVWNGRDEDDQLVPPGLYIYRLSVDSDTDDSQDITGTVAVTY